MSRSKRSAYGDQADIRALRKRAKLTQRRLADKAGVSTMTIWTVEHGRPISAASMKKIMTTLDPTRLEDEGRFIKCRWCGCSIGALRWDGERRELVIVDPLIRFTLRKGYFYHGSCIDEMKRAGELHPE